MSRSSDRMRRSRSMLPLVAVVALSALPTASAAAATAAPPGRAYEMVSPADKGRFIKALGLGAAADADEPRRS